MSANSTTPAYIRLSASPATYIGAILARRKLLVNAQSGEAGSGGFYFYGFLLDNVFLWRYNMFGIVYTGTGIAVPCFIDKPA